MVSPTFRRNGAVWPSLALARGWRPSLVFAGAVGPFVAAWEPRRCLLAVGKPRFYLSYESRRDSYGELDLGRSGVFIWTRFRL